MNDHYGVARVVCQGRCPEGVQSHLVPGSHDSHEGIKQSSSWFSLRNSGIRSPSGTDWWGGGAHEQPQGQQLVSAEESVCSANSSLSAHGLPPPSSISLSQMSLHSHHPKGTGAGPGFPGE